MHDSLPILRPSQSLYDPDTFWDTFCIGQWAGESFQELKQHLARASVLAYQDTRVVGDESPSGLGIVLV